MTRSELQSRIDALGPWYHTISLPSDEGPVSTPGEPYESAWGNVVSVMTELDYKRKTVLDIGSMEGMWAFSAEIMGASQIIATDCNWDPIQRFLFCREVFKSKVVPFFNVPVHELVRRLDVFLKGHDVKWKRHNDTYAEQSPVRHWKFDIVQFLGVAYHLRDPLQALLQIRSVIKDGGNLLFETAYLTQRTEPVMLFNVPSVPTVYADITTWWAPSLAAIEEMLSASCFKMTRCRTILDEEKIGRACMVAEAVPLAECDPRLVAELRNTYRTPGFEI